LLLLDDSSSSSCSSSSSSSSGSSSSDDEDRLYVEHEFDCLFAPPQKRPKIETYLDTVHQYSDEEFRRNFRLMRPIAYELIDNFGASPMFPPATHGGLPVKTPEEHVLSFLWYAANRSCIRDVAGRFNVAESSLHRMMRRVVDFILSIGPQVVKFPSDLQQMAEDFQKVSGVPGTVGCIDGSYIATHAPAKKIRSTYVNRHHFPSFTLQAVCDRRKRFVDVFTGHPSKVHDGRVFRTSSIAAKLPQICSVDKYHILGDAAYPIREYLLTPYRNYGKQTRKERIFNAKFSGTRVLIENAFADLKNRFRRLKQLEFWGVDFSTKFIIACCVLHNLCIDGGDDTVEEDEDDSAPPVRRVPDEDEDFPNEAGLRKRGEQKRRAVLAQMGIQ
ncbi:unnamed protein product, partial [Ixodes pacificus]